MARMYVGALNIKVLVPVIMIEIIIVHNNSHALFSESGFHLLLYINYNSLDLRDKRTQI